MESELPIQVVLSMAINCCSYKQSCAIGRVQFVCRSLIYNIGHGHYTRFFGDHLAMIVAVGEE